MITELSNTDYNAILKYYSVPINYKHMHKNKLVAEHLLATKLCRCIKKVKKNDNVSNKSAIAICNNSIFKNRNLKIHKYGCDKKYRLIKNRKTRRKLSKMGRMKLNNTRKSR